MSASKVHLSCKTQRGVWCTPPLHCVSPTYYIVHVFCLPACLLLKLTLSLPYVPRHLWILLCLTPENFTHQWGTPSQGMQTEFREAGSVQLWQQIPSAVNTISYGLTLLVFSAGTQIFPFHKKSTLLLLSIFFFYIIIFNIKVITPTNHNRSEQGDEPIRIPSTVTCNLLKAWEKLCMRC